MRTDIVFIRDEHQEAFKEGDTGYIDGYVQGGDGVPYAIVVRDDGHIGYAKTYNLKATGSFTAVQGQQNDE